MHGDSRKSEIITLNRLGPCFVACRSSKAEQVSLALICSVYAAQFSLCVRLLPIVSMARRCKQRREGCTSVENMLRRRHRTTNQQYQFGYNATTTNLKQIRYIHLSVLRKWKVYTCSHRQVAQWQRENAFVLDQQLAHCAVVGDESRNDTEGTSRL
jgi:hypothetical protein